MGRASNPQGRARLEQPWNMKWGLGYLSWGLLPPGQQAWGLAGAASESLEPGGSQLCSVHLTQPILIQARIQKGQVHLGNFQANLIPTQFQDESWAGGAHESNQEPTEAQICSPLNRAICS